MKRKIAWLGAILSGIYLLTIGILPDPVLWIDEGIAIAIFLKSTSYLGFELKKRLFFLKKNSMYEKKSGSKRKDDVTIDV